MKIMSSSEAAVKFGWSSRQPDRQINAFYYQRISAGKESDTLIGSSEYLALDHTGLRDENEQAPGLYTVSRKVKGLYMLTHAEYPILEFDDNKEAKLNPSAFADRKLSADQLIITFFPEVIRKLEAAGMIRLERTIPGENPVELYSFTDTPGILITLGQVGCPACGGNLDLFYALGIEKVMFCGGGGVLDRNIAVGELLLVDGAIRDEGFSFHYLEPSRYVYADPHVNEKIAAYLTEKGIPFLRGLTWTTDAIFRETKDRIQRRKSEGAKIVEMEQAGCLAVAAFRGFTYGALIYGGDDCASEEWSNRSWNSREGIRYDLVLLCRQILLDVFS